MSAAPGCGLVVLRGEAVYAAWAGGADAPRVRLSADDFERLGLLRGERLELRLPGREPAAVFVQADTWTEPWVWVQFAPQRAGGPAGRRPVRVKVRHH